MNFFFQLLFMIIFASSLTACGNKGSLKTPDQIKKNNEKKADKAAKEKQEKQEEDEQK